jgi:hypothetical protein
MNGEGFIVTGKKVVTTTISALMGGQRRIEDVVRCKETMFLRNVGIFVQVHTALQTRI